MMRYGFQFVLLLTGLLTGHGVLAGVVSYEADSSDFPNPERGFYLQSLSDSVAPSSLAPFIVDQLQDQGLTMVRRLYSMTTFRDGPIDASYLDHIAEDFAFARANGFKLNVRFAYTFNEPGPHPDAPLSVIDQHISQLAPLLAEHADIIAYLDAGFIGRWGEWHTSSNDNANPAGWRHVLTGLLAALPEERMVIVRTPGQKRSIFGEQTAIAEDAAFDRSPRSRTGHLNDCFLASDFDFGTYSGSADEVAEQKAYLSAETRYTPMSGETCNLNPPRSDCPTALVELAQMHWSSINILFQADVLQGWRDGGCFDEIKRRLGYRLALIEGQFPTQAAAGGDLAIRITLRNEGFAAFYNERPVDLVLRNTLDGTIYRHRLAVDPRAWLPDGGGQHELAESIGLPVTLPPGDYELLLDLPDASSALMDNPAFHVRLANQNLWEADSGMNRLLHTVSILGANEQLFSSSFE